MIRYAGTDSRYFLGMDTSVESEYLILETRWITNKNKFVILWVFKRTLYDSYPCLPLAPPYHSLQNPWSVLIILVTSIYVCVFKCMYTHLQSYVALLFCAWV